MVCPQTFIFQLETLPSCPLFMRNPINYESNHVLFNLTNPILHVKWALRLCFRDQKSYISGKEALLFLDGHKATSTWRCSNYYYFDNLIVKMEVLNLGRKGTSWATTLLVPHIQSWMQRKLSLRIAQQCPDEKTSLLEKYPFPSEQNYPYLHSPVEISFFTKW